MTGVVEARVEYPPGLDDRGVVIVVEQAGPASPADGVPVAVRARDGQITLVRMEFPMGVVGPGLVDLIRRAVAVTRAGR